MRERLAKTFILKNRSDIIRLFNTGQWFRGKFFSLVYRPSPDTKYLFSSSSRKKSAVERNRRKRYGRELIRKHKSDLPAGHYGIIIRYLPRENILPSLSSDLSALLRAEEGTNGLKSARREPHLS